VDSTGRLINALGVSLTQQPQRQVPSHQSTSHQVTTELEEPQMAEKYAGVGHVVQVIGPVMDIPI